MATGHLLHVNITVALRCNRLEIQDYKGNELVRNTQLQGNCSGRECPVVEDRDVHFATHLDVVVLCSLLGSSAGAMLGTDETDPAF